MRRQFVNGSVILKVALWYCGILGVFAAYTNWLPQIRGDAPEAAVAVDVSNVTPEMLQEMGEMIIYGSHDPLGMLQRGEGPIGKGQCPLCHMFFMEQKADRCPNLIADKSMSQKLLQVSEEERSHERVKEPRYKESMERLADGEENSGIVPHATTGGEYLLESEYCPNCFVVEGFGLKGTNDTVSPMPIINKPPIQLVDTEIVAVVAYLQMRDDASRFTAIESWENYFGKTLGEGEEAPKEEAPAAAGPKVALGSETPNEIVTKMTCYACHKIPGIEVAKTGMVGPLLIPGSSAPRRIASAEYKKAVAEGKAGATTPREYVIESIMNPGAFVVPGFADDMLKDFKHKFTVSGLDVMVDHLLAQTEETAIAEGLDRLPNEKEGPLVKPAEAKIDNGEKTVKKSIEEFGDEQDAHLSIAGLENTHAKSFN